MNYKHLTAYGLVILCLFFVRVPVSHAHRVIIFAWIEGDTVHTVSKFPGGNKVVDSTVVVYDGEGNRLLEGKTDAKGNFSFPIPKPAELKIVLEAGAGHQGEWTLSEKEVLDASGQTERSPAAKTDTTNAPAAKKTTPAMETDASSDERAASEGLSAEQIEAIVQRSLDKKLQPVINILADMHDPGPSLSDIFGGLGYILGLFGVAAFFAARKREK